MELRAIRTDKDLDWALAEIEQYFDAPPAPRTEEADRFDILTDLIEAYETREYPIEALDPIETLQGVARQAPAAQRKALRSVLAAFRDYESAELAELWEGEWLPERWIRLWSEGLEAAAGGKAAETPEQ